LIGIPIIPATHKSFATNHEKGKTFLQDGKLKTCEVESAEGAGFMANLARLGVKIPAM